jgi:hypothetical protein
VPWLLPLPSPQPPLLPLLEARTRHSFPCRPALKAQYISFSTKVPFTPSLFSRIQILHHSFPSFIYLFHVMNVRKMIDSYEQGRSTTVTRPSLRTSVHRTRPRPRPRTPGTESSPVTASQWSSRTLRPPNLKIVKEERPVAIVLKVRRHTLLVGHR